MPSSLEADVRTQREHGGEVVAPADPERGVRAGVVELRVLHFAAQFERLGDSAAQADAQRQAVVIRTAQPGNIDAEVQERDGSDEIDLFREAGVEPCSDLELRHADVEVVLLVEVGSEAVEVVGESVRATHAEPISVDVEILDLGAGVSQFQETIAEPILRKGRGGRARAARVAAAMALRMNSSVDAYVVRSVPNRAPVDYRRGRILLSARRHHSPALREV